MLQVESEIRRELHYRIAFFVYIRSATSREKSS
jgi:hypothetical protein